MNLTKKNSILVAEDNLLNQRLIELLLTHLGYEFKLVKNGRECCEEIFRNNYRLILMDLSMPEMDGFEATKIIRETLKSEDQPHIIAVTASNATLEECLNAGLDGCVTKPIDLRKLRYMFSLLPTDILATI